MMICCSVLPVASSTFKASVRIFSPVGFLYFCVDLASSLCKIAKYAPKSAAMLMFLDAPEGFGFELRMSRITLHLWRKSGTILGRNRGEMARILGGVRSSRWLAEL